MSRVTCVARPGPGGRLYTCEAGGCDHALGEEEVAAMEAQLEQEMETTDCSDPDVIQVVVTDDNYDNYDDDDDDDDETRRSWTAGRGGSTASTTSCCC